MRSLRRPSRFLAGLARAFAPARLLRSSCLRILPALAITCGAHAAAPTIEINANHAGCVKPDLVNADFRDRSVLVSLIFTKDHDSAEGPCVCRSGLYYVSILAADRVLPRDRAWMYADSYFQKDTDLAVLSPKPQQLPHRQDLVLPLKRGTLGLPYAHYYLDLGCP